MNRTVRCLVLVAVLLSAGLSAAQTAPSSGATGRKVEFPLTQFDDTLFTAVDGAFRARLDPDGDVWYTTEGGVVHVDPEAGTRELFTKMEGLPSSYTMGLDIDGDKVIVGTDLGVALIDRATGQMQKVTPDNSPLPDYIVQEVRVDGNDLWLGMRFYGVAVWDMTKPASDADAWTFKNTSTTADYAQPIRRIVPSASAVWVATDGDGAWRYDRASRTWNVTTHDDGLPDTSALAVVERGDEVWFGTPHGLAVRDAAGGWRVYNRTNSGIPDDRVTDVDIVQTVERTMDVFAATPKGLWQLDPDTNRNVTRAQNFGILGSYLFDDDWTEEGWLFSTPRGVSFLREGAWSYYATGPNTGPSWGPLSYGFTSASVGETPGYLWFGTSFGASAYKLPTGGHPGYWQNFGAWQNYPGSVVNWIDTEGNTTWFGTNVGAFGFEHESGRWIPKLSTNSRNLVYGLDAVGDELWIALFGDGLVMENRTTGVTRTWDFQTVGNPLPDQYLTDVRVDGDTVWLGSSVGVIKMDRLTGSVRGTYGKTDGLPGNAIVFRVLPEGPIVWIGTKEDGVAKFDVASGKVSRVWNHTKISNFPDGEVRSLYREGGRLWVGTTDGLARIDITTGDVKSWNQSNSPLVQSYVNGIASADGLLYLATLSGVQRMNIQSGEFYPMRDGPGVIRASASGTSAGVATRVNVKIDSPRDGTAVTGVTDVRGSALAFGERVERVEVKIGEGAWTPAHGAGSWTFAWDTRGLPVNTPVTVAARAFAGNLTGEAEILVTPVAAPTIPLAIQEIAPDAAYAGRTLRFGARVEGDEPLTASLFYRPAGTSSYTRLQLERQGNLFFGSIPARDMREGELRYYLEAQSGLLVETAGGDATEPSVLTVAPAPRLAVAVEGPVLVAATAGNETRFALNVSNVGSEPATFTLSAAGLRASWVLVPPEDLELAPGETRAVNVRLSVPAAAFADNTTLTFEARDASGVAEPAIASVPVRIDAAPGGSSPTPVPAPSTGRGAIPAPAVGMLVALVAAIALARRRRA
ncbi:MAG TPA: Ig-like domain-containing protein [Candidatus Thermoplasmatota archaeon]|nr:Ig-like domain-containing protein [Candidatus Thermoplasmatota archaeon]